MPVTIGCLYSDDTPAQRSTVGSQFKNLTAPLTLHKICWAKHIQPCCKLQSRCSNTCSESFVVFSFFFSRWRWPFRGRKPQFIELPVHHKINSIGYQMMWLLCVRTGLHRAVRRWIAVCRRRCRSHIAVTGRIEITVVSTEQNTRQCLIVVLRTWFCALCDK